MHRRRYGNVVYVATQLKSIIQLFKKVYFILIVMRANAFKHSKYFIARPGIKYMSPVMPVTPVPISE